MTITAYRTVNEVAYRLRGRGVFLPTEYKRRDINEPRHAEKQMAEDVLAAAWTKLFRWQAAEVRTWLMRVAKPPGKAHFDFEGEIHFEDEDFKNDKLEANIFRLLVLAILAGLDIFIDGQEGSVQIDWTDPKVAAAKWAAEHAGELIKNVLASTRKAVAEAVQAFINTPGMTIKDVMDRIPFKEARSRLIATTEITNAYAEGELIAGRLLKKQFPDVRVVKKWFTNNDDIVRRCPICWPLHLVEVEINEEFPGGYLRPGETHPRCRCWIVARTRI